MDKQANPSASNPYELSNVEKSCYDWFVEQQKQLPNFYHRLSEQDRNTINKQVRYEDNPEQVTQCRRNYAEAFFTVAKEAGIPLRYDSQTLIAALLKITKAMHSKSIQQPHDLLSHACMYLALSSAKKNKQRTPKKTIAKIPPLRMKSRKNGAL